MTRRAFTLIELIIVILIIAIIAAVVIPNIAARQNQNVSTPVNIPPTPSAGSLSAPERPAGYEVHTVNVPYTGGLEAARIHETLVSWLREHSGHEIISIIRTDAGVLVIVTKNR